jgi:tocopherol O-methyltransferase
MQTLPPLNDRIRHFYDRSTGIWLDTWGEHMHHGYYGPDGTMQQDHLQAQIDLITEFLQWGNVAKASCILDAGCGVGGSARLLAKVLDAKVLGLTLSPVQAEQAARLNQIAGLAGQVRVEVQDVLQLDAAQGHFDLIWSLESAEHIPGKQRLLQVFFDALLPGGKLLLATWCHRDTPPKLDIREHNLLQKIGKYYHLPPLISLGEYEQMVRDLGFLAVKTADWTAAVSPFWPAVIRSALRWRSIAGLLRAGGPALQGAWAMQYMLKGYRTGALRFGLLQAQKP